MGKREISKGQILHHKGETVESVAIILKGSFTIRHSDDLALAVGKGTILGAFHESGSLYDYDYVAAEDSTIFEYGYNNEDDLAAAISATPTIAPVMVSASIKKLNKMLDILETLYEKSKNLCLDLKANYTDYRDVCSKLMLMPNQYDAVTSLVPPEQPYILANWQTALCRTCLEKDELLRKSCYSADINFCIGTIMLASQLAQAMLSDSSHLAVIISRTGSNKRLLRTAKILKQQGAPIVLLSSSEKTPLAKYADEFLYVANANTLDYMDMGSMIFSVGVRYYQDVLFGLLLAQDFDGIEEFSGRMDNCLGHYEDKDRLW